MQNTWAITLHAHQAWVALHQCTLVARQLTGPAPPRPANRTTVSRVRRRPLTAGGGGAWYAGDNEVRETAPRRPERLTDESWGAHWPIVGPRNASRLSAAASGRIQSQAAHTQRSAIPAVPHLMIPQNPNSIRGSQSRVAARLRMPRAPLQRSVQSRLLPAADFLWRPSAVERAPAVRRRTLAGARERRYSPGGERPADTRTRVPPGRSPRDTAGALVTPSCTPVRLWRQLILQRKVNRGCCA